MECPSHFFGDKHSTLETPGIENSRRSLDKCQTSWKEYKRETSKKSSVCDHVLDVFLFVISFNAPTICEVGRGWGQRPAGKGGLP